MASSPHPFLDGYRDLAVFTPAELRRRQWIGFYALARKEVRRFLKVYHQTLLAPVITALLFLTIFTIIPHTANIESLGDATYVQFVAAGLVMMSVIQAAFANSSSVIVMGKVMRTIVDYLMPPFGTNFLILGWVAGSVVRGLSVGALLLAVFVLILGIPVLHPWMALGFAVLAAVLLGLLGIALGVQAQSFDQIAALTNYIVTPLSFLSGTFFMFDHVPAVLQPYMAWNPFAYLIEGFRYSLIGVYRLEWLRGMGLLASCLIGLTLWVGWTVHKGTRLKP
jgi:ABC-2 type transport system permease protein